MDLWGWRLPNSLHPRSLTASLPLKRDLFKRKLIFQAFCFFRRKFRGVYIQPTKTRGLKLRSIELHSHKTTPKTRCHPKSKITQPTPNKIPTNKKIPYSERRTCLLILPPPKKNIRKSHPSDSTGTSSSPSMAVTGCPPGYHLFCTKRWWATWRFQHPKRWLGRKERERGEAKGWRV